MNPESPKNAPELPGLDWHGLSRRRFLKGMLAITGATVVGAGVTACAPEGSAGADGRPLLFLSAVEAAILTALGEAVIPTQPGFPTLAEAEVVRRADEEFYFLGESIRNEIHSAIQLLQVSPFVYGRFSRFTRLDVAGRREVLEAMQRSRSEILRAVGTNLKLLIHFFYFGHPSAWKAIGYDGPFSHLPPIMSEQRLYYAHLSAGPRA